MDVYLTNLSCNLAHLSDIHQVLNRRSVFTVERTLVPDVVVMLPHLLRVASVLVLLFKSGQHQWVNSDVPPRGTTIDIFGVPQVRGELETDLALLGSHFLELLYQFAFVSEEEIYWHLLNLLVPFNLVQHCYFIHFMELLVVFQKSLGAVWFPRLLFLGDQSLLLIFISKLVFQDLFGSVRVHGIAVVNALDQTLLHVSVFAFEILDPACVLLKLVECGLLFLSPRRGTHHFVYKTVIIKFIYLFYIEIVMK